MTAENDSGMRWFVPLFPCSIFDLQMTAEPQKKFCKEENVMVGQQTTEGAWTKIRRIFLGSDLLSRRNRNNVLAMGIIGFGYTFFEEIVTTYMQFYYSVY